MTVELKRVQAANIATGVLTNIYVVPAGKRAILRSLYQGYDGAAVDADIGFTVRAAGFLWSQKVSGFDHRVWPLSTVLYASQAVAAQHSQAGMYTMLQVAEMDATGEGANLWYVDFISVTAAQTYTVPAGKRVRVREAVLCNHADTVAFTVSVDSIGYLVKASTTPRVGNVIGMNMVVNAGEIIRATATGVGGHVFLSGVIEDA